MFLRAFLAGTAAAVLGSSFAPAASADPVDLRMKYAAGEKRRYAIEQTMEMQSPIPIPGFGQPLRMKGQLGIEVVALLPDGSAKLRIVKGPMQAEPPNPLFAAHTQPLAAEATSSPRGELKVLRTAGLSEGAAQALEQILRSFGGVLPPKPVEPGATWSVPIDQQLPAGALPGATSAPTLRGDASLSFRGLEKKNGRTCAMIPGTATLKLDASAMGKDPSQGGMHVDAAGKGQGESCFDLDKGDFVESTMSFEMTVTFTGAQIPMPMQMKAVSKVDFKRIEDGAVEVNAPPPAAPQVPAGVITCPPGVDCSKLMMPSPTPAPTPAPEAAPAPAPEAAPAPAPEAAPAPAPAPSGE